MSCLAKTLPKVRITGFTYTHKAFVKGRPREIFSVRKFLPIFLARGMHFFLFFGQYGKRNNWTGYLLEWQRFSRIHASDGIYRNLGSLSI